MDPGLITHCGLPAQRLGERAAGGAWVCARCSRVLVDGAGGAHELAGKLSVRAWWRSTPRPRESAYRATSSPPCTATIEIARTLDRRLGGGQETFVVLASILAIGWCLVMLTASTGLERTLVHGPPELVRVLPLLVLTGALALVRAHLAQTVVRQRLVVRAGSVEIHQGPLPVQRVRRGDGDHAIARPGASIVCLERRGAAPAILIDRLGSPSAAAEVAVAVEDALAFTRTNDG